MLALTDLQTTAVITGAFAVVVASISGGFLLLGNFLSKKLDTGNGRKLGQTVHDMEQTLEIAQAQAHTNAKELIGLHEKLDRHIEDHER